MRGWPHELEDDFSGRYAKFVVAVLPVWIALETIGSFWPYATAVFDYVRRTMPLNDPKSLKHDEVYALVGYLLGQNGVIGKSDAMTAKTLPAVRTRDGFVRFSRGQ